VTDFGLAHDATDTLTLTYTGDFLGTLRYVAPERLTGPGDERADIYGLGVTLYKLVCGRPAIAAADRSTLLYKVLHQDPPRPRQLDPLIARDLETIVLKAKERDPAQRYATAEALAEDLRRFQEDQPIVARPVSFWERGLKWARRRPALAASVVLVHLLLAGLIGSSAWSYLRINQALQRADVERIVASASDDGTIIVWDASP
jgi:eukaryotic-like serine/threonine-protein kinase